ncbi:MAG TPA: benzoate-CoA ligase family protein, partial [Blastocatellia bacterium]|nr:benzoate-CoA ligase family protein [Blastocatellia bacterium]
CGVKEGDRVALLLYDSPEFIASFLAIAAEGAIGVLINTFLPPRDIAFILSDSGARTLIAEQPLWSKLLSSGGENVSAACGGGRVTPILIQDEDRPCLNATKTARLLQPVAATTEETPAFLLYTSGSTGAPKGVLHRHGAVPVTVDGYSRHVLQLTREDRLFSASRLFFAYGLGNSLSFPLADGATVILETERPAPEKIAALFKEKSPTVFFGVPATYRGLLEYQANGGQVDASSLRLCISAGEALPEKVFEDWQNEFGLTILDGIGSTEMLQMFISNRQGEARPGSSGKVIEGYEAKLIDQNGQPVTTGELGYLWIRGGSAAAGYWDRPDLTQATIQDGWVRTGDIYRKDEDGYYYHIGRADDCFKVHGLWVSPIEVESVLAMHDSVVEAAVIAAEDADGLATAKAFVVIREGRESEALRRELMEFAGARLPRYKAPSQIEFVREMPRTSTGKIQRYKLRSNP